MAGRDPPLTTCTADRPCGHLSPVIPRLPLQEVRLSLYPRHSTGRLPSSSGTLHHNKKTPRDRQWRGWTVPTSPKAHQKPARRCLTTLHRPERARLAASPRLGASSAIVGGGRLCLTSPVLLNCLANHDRAQFRPGRPELIPWRHSAASSVPLSPNRSRSSSKHWSSELFSRNLAPAAQ
jgi:hypothetical protein